MLKLLKRCKLLFSFYNLNEFLRSRRSKLGVKINLEPLKLIEINFLIGTLHFDSV